MQRNTFTSILALLLAMAPVKAQQPTGQRQAGPLPLEIAIERFLQRNLSLEAARFEVQAAEAERVAARLRPRPGLTASAENLRVSGETPFTRLYETGVTITQPVELGGQRRLREEVADRGVGVAEAGLNTVLRQRLFELKRAFYESLLAQATQAIAQQNRANFSELVRFNTARFEEGDISEGELIKTRLEQIKFDSAVTNASLALRLASIRLLEMIGESDFSTADTLQAEGVLTSQGPALSLADLKQSALANRADVKLAEAELARAVSVSRLERARGKGEITPYVGYKRVGIDNTVLAGVTVPLPFGNRNQGAIARAEAESRVAEANLRLARNRALADVEAAYRAFETAREQVRAFESEILRKADESLDIQLTAYREGASEFITLLDAQRTRAEVRTNYYKALFDYNISLFQLELATGMEIKK